MRFKLVVAILATLGATIFLQHRLNEARSEFVTERDRPFVPPLSDAVKAASLGHHTLVADAYWLRTIQYRESCDEREAFPEDLYEMADFVTDLDSQYCLAYFYAGLFLLDADGDRDEIVPILRKGSAACEDYWRNPFLLGFYSYMYDEDYEMAANYMEIACERHDGHRLYCNLAARIRAMTGNPELGIELLRQMLGQVDDEQTKTHFQLRIKELISKINERDINAAIESYRERAGKYPEKIGDIFAGGPVLGVPPEGIRPLRYIKPPEHPLEGHVYVYNPETGEFRSDPPVNLDIYESKIR